MHLTRNAIATVAVIVGTTAITACSDEASTLNSDAYPNVTANPSLVAALPADVRDDGELTIVTDPNYPPMEFMQDRQIVGADIELGRAIAAKFGLRARVHTTPFSNVVPSVAIQEFELGMSALWADNPEASMANMVTYLKAGTQVAINKSEASRSPEDGFCGQKVAVEEGSDFIDTLVKKSAKCVKLGKPKIEVLAANNQAKASKLLENGAADALVGDSPTVQFSVSQSNGELIALGQPVDIRPYGIAVSPLYPELTNATQQALKELIDEGAYGEILARWQISQGAVTEPEVLIGSSPART